MMTKTIFLTTAIEIGEKLRKTAFYDKDQYNWIGYENYSSFDHSQNSESWKPLPPNLYSGTSGIALFFGYLYDITNNLQYRKIAEGAIHNAINNIKRISRKNRFGFYSGKIGIAYVAGLLSQITKNLELKEYAQKTIKEMNGDFNSPHFLDVISGNAGAIPPLIKLSKILDLPEAISLARNLAKELITKATVSTRGISWDSKYSDTEHAKTNLTGFSHGASGMAYALLDIFSYTSEEIFLQCAEDAIRYENSWFNSDINNWPDFRPENNQNKKHSKLFHYPITWCHGAPGIGLCRIKAYSILGEKYMVDCKIAIEKCSQYLLDSTNHDFDQSLCHGSGGISEILLIASDILNDVTLEEKVSVFAKKSIKKHSNSPNGWPCTTRYIETPYLMTGLAGIGFFYLRLFDKKRVHSILMN